MASLGAYHTTRLSHLVTLMVVSLYRLMTTHINITRVSPGADYRCLFGPGPKRGPRVIFGYCHGLNASPQNSHVES